MGKGKNRPPANPPPPPPDEGMGRIELQAPREWIEKLDAAANALGVSRSAYIRMACNRQMRRDGLGGDE